MAGTEPYVRDDVRAFLTMLEGLNRPDIRDVPLSETRTAMAAMQEFAQVPAREIASVVDLACAGPGGEIPLRLYDPRTERGPSPLLVFIHGGGFVAGTIESYHRFCTILSAELDLPLVSVEYRLAPEYPFPAAPDDCEAAARWLAASPAELGFEITGLIPIGDSAGGNLAIVVEQALRAKPAAVPVIMQVPIYPICDNYRRHPSNAELGTGFMLTADVMDFFDESYKADTSSARLYPLIGELAGSAPTVLLTAGLDPLRDSGRAYAAGLIEAGVEVTYLERRGIIHGFVQIMQAIPSAQEDVAVMIAAMKDMLERTR